MESRDFGYLQEAYQEIYQLDEEVEIATEYFYEMGLNEYGVNALIEELGVEEFVEWVYDIAESYTLEEETRLQRMSGRKNKILTGPKGSRPQSTTKTREKKQGGVTMRTSSGPKSTIRKRAARAAAETQPETREEPTKTKKGIAGAIEYAKKRAAADSELLRQGMRNLASSPAARGAATAAAALRAGGEFAYRAGQKAAETETGKNVKKTLGKAALAAAGAAGAGVGSIKVGKSPAAAAGRAVGTFLRKMRAEDVEFVDWVENLWEDGYDLSDYTWEGLYEAYSDLYEGFQSPFATPPARGRSMAGDPNKGERLGNPARLSPMMKAAQKSDQLQRTELGSAREKKQTRRAKHLENMYGAARRTGKFAEEYEAYNIIADYLLDEGYADTIESAETIIASMSEDWIVDILEVTGGGKVDFMNPDPARGMKRSPFEKAAIKQSSIEGKWDRISRSIYKKHKTTPPEDYYDDEDSEHPSLTTTQRRARASREIATNPSIKKLSTRYSNIGNAIDNTLINRSKK